MTPEQHTEANELADKYRDEDFNRNPNGYTVAPYVNTETTSTAFILGFEAGVASEGKRLEERLKNQARTISDCQPEKVLALLGQVRTLTAENAKLRSDVENLKMVCKRLSVSKKLETRDKIVEQCRHLYSDIGDILRNEAKNKAGV